jgi:peroxiredoxin
MAIDVGSPAAPVAGVDLTGPRVLVFYKVTCGVTKMATPAIGRLARAYPGRVVGVGQDPQPQLDEFAAAYSLDFPQVPDPEPYRASDAYGILSAPTAILVDARDQVAAVAESWDREAWNGLAATLAGLTGSPAVAVSEPQDGLPDYKPG